MGEDHVVQQCDGRLPTRVADDHREGMLPGREGVVRVHGDVVVVRGVAIRSELERAGLLAVNEERQVPVPIRVRVRSRDDAKRVHPDAIERERRGDGGRWWVVRDETDVVPGAIEGLTLVEFRLAGRTILPNTPSAGRRVRDLNARGAAVGIVNSHVFPTPGGERRRDLQEDKGKDSQ